MNILRFDIQAGIYLTETNQVHATAHSHPAAEIILAKNNTFELSVDGRLHSGLKFAVIDANIPHSLHAEDAALTILIVEYRDKFLANYWAAREMQTENGFYIQQEAVSGTIIQDIITAISGEYASEYDPRIQQVLDYLKTYTVHYSDLKKQAAKIACLSAGRLARLFKQNTGISLKNYLVWSHLRASVCDHLHQNQYLRDAALVNGFYDQPHFNRSYKSFIGTRPARTYKSISVQKNMGRPWYFAQKMQHETDNQ